MFQTNKTQDTRTFFFETWEKNKQKKSLTPLETEVFDVMLAHPEYHALFDNPAQVSDRAYFAELGDTNPFLHLGLHLALREQVATNRPFGIAGIYNTLTLQLNAPLEAEHQLMQCLEDCLWIAQKNHALPDETHYLNQCTKLLVAS